MNTCQTWKALHFRQLRWWGGGSIMVSLHESNTCYVMSIFHPTIFASPYGYTVIFIIACNTYCSIYIFWLCICFLFFVYITLWVDVIYLMWTNRQHLNYWPYFSTLTLFYFHRWTENTSDPQQPFSSKTLHYF